MSKDDQSLLTKAMDDAMAHANSLTRNGDAEFVKKLQELGMTLVPVDKNEFRDAVRPVVDQMAKTDWDPAFYEKVKAALK